MTDMSAIPPLDEPEKAGLTLPLRFVWQSDEFGRISAVSAEFEAATEPGRVLTGRTWDELSHQDGLDPTGALAQALARRDTWSGVTVNWPLGGRLLPVELAGLPVFDRDRSFRGFRGFGVVRDAPPVEAPPPPDMAQEPSTETDRTAPAAGEEIHGPTPVLPFRMTVRPGLNPDEHLAFREIARALNARGPEGTPAPAELPAAVSGRVSISAGDGALGALETLPAGVLIHRLGTPLFANHAFLDLVGFEDLGALAQHGLDALFEEPPRAAGPRGLAIRTADGRLLRAEAQLKAIRWQGEAASLLFLGAATYVRTVETGREQELAAILDTATDGVIVLDGAGRMISANRSAEALFGYEAAELEGRSVTLLLGADSHRVALDYLEGLKSRGLAAVMNDGREVVGVTRRGGTVPLFMTMGRIGEDDGEPRFCAILRDITHFKKAEEELRAAKKQAEAASAQKSDFLARVSHEIRTPLNAILGFTEVMMEERFGTVGSERYRQYIGDIHQSGTHIISLVNDLLDLAKIEAGKLDLNFARVNMGDVVTGAVALLQPQANSNRIIIRTALAPNMPAVIADQRSLKQIALNLLSNAVKYTPAGGQVIVSTAMTELGQAVLRVRDTGPGMDEHEIATALEPFRQLPTTNPDGGTGLGLPLTKALAEANRAQFSIHSAAGSGTMVEVLFPPTRVLGE